MSKISIVAALDERDRLVKEANDPWEALVAKFEARIPERLRKFFDYQYRMRNSFKTLSELFQQMVSFNRIEICYKTSVYLTCLRDMGFENFEDLRSAMKELEEAWGGAIRIEVKDDGPREVSVCYYSTEVTPE